MGLLSGNEDLGQILFYIDKRIKEHLEEDRQFVYQKKEYLKLWNVYLENNQIWHKVTAVKNLNYAKPLIPLNSNKTKHDKIMKKLNSEKAFYYLVEDMSQHFDYIEQL